MASDAQIAANRRNAGKSTGPRTAAGKENSRRNALRHGLAAEHILIFDEDPDDFVRFRAAMAAALEPVGEVEEALSERIVLGNWRLRRVWRAEAASINEAAVQIARKNARAEVYEQVLAELQANPPAEPADKQPWEPPRNLRHIAWNLVNEMTDAQIEAALTPDDAPRPKPPPEKPDTPAWPEPRMTSFSRYEAAIERGLHRAFAALERLQARRRAAEAEAEAAPATRQQRRHADRTSKFAERSQFPAAPPMPPPAKTRANGTPPP